MEGREREGWMGEEEVRRENEGGKVGEGERET